MRIEGELDEIPTVVWGQKSSRSRSTVPARLETFITAGALETQFWEPRNPLSGEIEFLEILTLDRLDRSLSSAEIVTVFGLGGGALRLLHFFDDKRLVDRNTSALGLTPMLSESKRGSSRQI